LKAAEDAVVIDSDDKDADVIFEEVVTLSSKYLLKD
jgi:cytidylate kinase